MRRVAVAGVAALTLVAPIVVEPAVPAGPPAPQHAALAGWFSTQVQDGTMLVAPRGVWADLVRDLDRIDPPTGTKRVTTGPSDAGGALTVVLGDNAQTGAVVARFGTGANSLTVLHTGSRSGYLDAGHRVAVGIELAGNQRLHASEPVRAALRAGQLDPRAMVLIASLCQSHDIEVASVQRPTAEVGTAVPDRAIVVSEVDGHRVADQPATAAALTDWLRAQQPPYAPSATTPTPAGLLISWRLPARMDQFSL
jgi:hypothetical protein